MKKRDLLKLLEEYPDDREVVFWDSEYGEYIENITVRGEEWLGRFGWKDKRAKEFYSFGNVSSYQCWEYLGYDTLVVVLEDGD